MPEEQYAELLDRAFSKLPSLSAERSDFVIPKAEVMNEGVKTIIRNISQIADRARRGEDEIARYVSKELSVPVNVAEHRMIISGRFNSDDIDRRIARYFELYVICKECKKPDTKLEAADKGLYLVCEACGARYWIKSY
ncbi:MAG: translation initiation factor IF-2 subunit beta [Candidatus Micrarchaeota archaeon]|nr:translation initiation factor IF-2 subunit beta [Candidatus Micrarchaeota archaeon]